MTKSEKEQLILMLYQEAKNSSHIFPEMAVMEILLESSWMKSKLAVEGNNVFGQKWSKNSIYDKISLPTKEFVDGQWVIEQADFVKYPTIKDAFTDRMKLLVRLTNTYKEYKNALNARDNIEFITEVSRRWSTDIERGNKVIKLYEAYKYLFEKQTPTPVIDKLSDFWTNFSNKFKKDK